MKLLMSVPCDNASSSTHQLILHTKHTQLFISPQTATDTPAAGLLHRGWAKVLDWVPPDCLPEWRSSQGPHTGQNASLTTKVATCQLSTHGVADRRRMMHIAPGYLKRLTGFSCFRIYRRTKITYINIRQLWFLFYQQEIISIQNSLIPGASLRRSPSFHQVSWKQCDQGFIVIGSHCSMVNGSK